MNKNRPNTHRIDLLVGENIRRIRKLAGISQQELGDKIGITFQQIQKNEGGENRIAASRLWEFAEILNVEISEFFVGDDEEQGESYITAISQDSFERMSDRELKMVRLMRNCEPHVQTAIIAMLNTISHPKDS